MPPLDDMSEFDNLSTLQKQQPPNPCNHKGEEPLSLELPKTKSGKPSHGNSLAKSLMFKHRQQKPSGLQPSELIDLESYRPKNPPRKVKKWLSNELFQLDQSQKTIILSSTAWLTDDIIDAVQKLLKKKMGAKSGFQSVTLGHTLHFDVQSDQFVQILHNGHGHWLTISTIGVRHPEVSVYDSMYPTVSTHAKRQIASLLVTSQKEIKLRHMDVQMQSGGYDCGLFAIAFATALADGEQPGRCLFDQNKMRQHLLKCLQEAAMTPFPLKKNRRNGCRVKSWDTIEVHCICRMPEVNGVDMIECSNCKTWYHIPLCISVPRDATQSKKEWFCNTCT